MRITIVGGGNIGTQFAVHCAEKGHQITLFTSEPDIFDKNLYILDENGHIIHEGMIKKATNDPHDAFACADLIFVTYPAILMKDIADLIYHHTDEKVIIGVVPGTGGSECAFRNCILRGNVFFGIERVPAIARLVQKGKKVKSIGYRNELHVAAFPRKAGPLCAKIVEEIFDIRCTEILCYLSLTMTPSNPILHTTRLRTLFADWHEGKYYDSVPLFYEEWDDESSRLLLACDDEIQKICHALPEFDLSDVKSLKIHYESSSISEMTRKISSIPAFKGLTAPLIKTEEGFVPDLHSRYFTADFSFGLRIIQQIAKYAAVSVPNIDEVMDWYKHIAKEHAEFLFSDYGINSRSELVAYYSM